MPCGRLPQSLLPLRLIVFRKTAAVIRLHSLSTNSRTSLIEDLEVLLESAKAIFLLFGFTRYGKKMTRIFVQRGSVGSSSNANRPPSNSVPQPSASQAASSSREQDVEKQVLEDQSALDEPRETSESGDGKILKHDDPGASTEVEGGSNICFEEDGSMHDVSASTVIGQETSEPCVNQKDSVQLSAGSFQIINGGSYPPPPPAPPPKPFSTNLGPRRNSLGSSNTARISSLRRQSAWPGVSMRSPSESRPSSPRSCGEGEGYNSADEQGPCYASSFDDSV
ncbi:hypothetical protein B296_00035507 [Ensete ventricosum]|uniref:Uncharacterized protein n=1 Tax=Ensete ventricosum TaxID=4639 RepID=A0A427A5H1_ENSVE|nr:hypothetical protein B296_00035507 [Ensete ventricosum]